MIRSQVMRPARRLPHVVAFVLGVVALGVVRPPGPGPSGTALAQVASPPDSALLLVFENGTPVAREHSMFQRSGDSLVVTASLERQFVDDNGARHPFRKSMLLVVDSRDLGLLRYLSNQSFNGHVTTRGWSPARGGSTTTTSGRGAPGRSPRAHSRSTARDSPSSKRALATPFRAALRRARSTDSDTLSTPTASAAARARSSVSVPVPQ